jgi:hypothetical protein
MTGAGKTGIEIKVGLTPGQQVIGKVLHALHLDVIGELVAKIEKAVITVDGHRIEEPLYEAHFIEAAPGEHRVEMYMKPKGLLVEAIQQLVRGTKLTTTVEPGKVTVLLYTPEDGPGATLRLVETRPA